MRRIDTEELKRIQLEILDYVVGFCNEHGIHYFLDAGTLLGAIRHKGYIPWDDDIDIGMPREDYDKFLKLFNSKQTGRYELHCMDLELDYPLYLPFAKVYDNDTLVYEPDPSGMKLAVNIDIWVFDNAPDDDKELAKFFKTRNRCAKFRSICLNKNLRVPRGNFIRRTLVYLFRFIVRHSFSADRLSKKLLGMLRKYDSQPTKRLGSLAGWTETAACDRRAFDGYVDVDFEGRKYKAPSGYDEWLTALYGDYMTPPPVEERVTHHTFEAYTLKD